MNTDKEAKGIQEIVNALDAAVPKPPPVPVLQLEKCTFEECTQVPHPTKYYCTTHTTPGREVLMEFAEYQRVLGKNAPPWCRFVWLRDRVNRIGHLRLEGPYVLDRYSYSTGHTTPEPRPVLLIKRAITDMTCPAVLVVDAEDMLASVLAALEGKTMEGKVSL